MLETLAYMGNTSSRIFDVMPYDTKDDHFACKYCNSGAILSGKIADKRLKLFFLLSLLQEHSYSLGFDNLSLPNNV